MFTPREIRDTEFERIVRGYNPEDVDGFLAQLADQIEQLEADKAASEKKLMLLAEKVDEMREDEGRLRSVLISAEKMKESIIAEAQTQAQAMLAEAQSRSEALVSEAQNRYDSIVGEIAARSAQEEEKLRTLRSQVSAFKNSMLSAYKQHLELIKEIPEFESEPVDELQPVVEPAPQPEPVEEVPVSAPVEPAAPAFTAPAAEVPESPAMPQFEMPVAPSASAADPFDFGKFEAPAPTPQVELNEVKPVSSASSFASFMADDDSNIQFGKMDFGESFTFGKE